MANPYDAPFSNSRATGGNTTYYTKASGRGSSAWNKSNNAVKNPYNQSFNATGDAPNQDYSKPASASKSAAAAASSTKPNANANFQMPKPNAPANAAPKGILGKISTYGKAFITSPSATVKDVASGQGIKAVNNGAIIVNRAPVSVTSKVKQQQAKNLPAGTPGQLDHVQPLEIGGDNNPKNLKLIPKAQDQANNAVENYLGGQLKANVINAQQAKILNQQYKQGKISQQDVYNAAKKGGKPPATSAGLLPKAAVSVGHAGRAVVRPLTDVATGNGGKAVHDTAQLTSDVTGNLANSVADQTRKQVSFLGGKTRTEKGLPGGAQLVKDQQTASKMNLQPTTKQMMKNIYPEAQITATHMLATGKPEANVQKYLQAAQKTKSAGDRKTLATAVATGSFFVGGGEAAAAKDLAKKPLADIAAHTVKDATIGATGNTALTEAQNPNASGKELATSAAVGGAAGGLLPIAAKGAGKAVSKGSSLLRKVPEVNAVINPDHVSQGLVKDTIVHTPSTELHLGSEMAGKKIDNAKVAQYTKQIKDGEPIEPVVVHDVNGQKVVVDGQHRLAAMQKLGITDIPTVEKLPGAEPKAPIAEPAAAAPKPVANETSQSYQGTNGVSGKAARDGKTLDTMHQNLGKLADNNKANTEAVSTIKKVANNPNADVTVYRATPGGTINHGDWVFLTKGEADRFTKTPMGSPKPGVKVVAQKAKASDISWTGKNLEFAYTPKDVAPQVGKTVEAPKPVPAEAPGTRALKPSETAHMEPIGGYTHSKDMTNDYADMLRGQEQQVKGGQMVKQADGTVKRISEHSKFYREFYHENGKAPTVADYKAEAVRQLESGKAMHGASEDYQKLVAREAKPLPKMERPAPATPDVPTKASGSAQSLEAKAVQNSVAKEFKDAGKTEYSTGSYKTETQKAIDLVDKNPQKAMDIAMGRTPGDNTIHEVAVRHAVQNKALKEGDTNTILQLLQSPHHAVTSEAAQRLGAEGYGDGSNVVANLAHLSQARKAAFKARTGKTADTLTKNTIKEAGPAVKTFTPKVTKETWNSFVESLRC